MNDDTLLVMLGRRSEEHYGCVNPPVYRTSTVLYPTIDALQRAKPHAGVYYGRFGTPTTFALEEAVAALEGGHRAIAVSSGLAAIASSTLALLKTGDHVLVADSVYPPTRFTFDQLLRRFGVESTYYDPRIGSGIKDLIKSNTRLVYTESPGSFTFEIQDIPAIAEAAHAKGAIVLMDNTWATPLYFKPFDHGVDVVIHSATKYLAGHSDTMLGTVSSTQAIHDRLRDGVAAIGAIASPDDCYATLRGMRTLSIRLARHYNSGLILAEWLRKQPEVARVLHPALPGDPGYALWKRDFSGAPGLFGLILHPYPTSAVMTMLDSLKLFGKGWSWGGYESLLIPTNPKTIRSATTWDYGGTTLRIHVGLEDPQDLIADLTAGFALLRRLL